MKFTLNIFAGFLFFCASTAMASGISDILQQSSGVFVGSQGNNGRLILNAEQRKQAIDDNTRQQIVNIDSRIEDNNRRIDEWKSQLIDAKIDLHSLNRDYSKGVIPWNEYANEKRRLNAQMDNLHNQIMSLEQQNDQLRRSEGDVYTTAEAQKRQVDANTGDAEVRQNGSVLDNLLRQITNH